MQQSAEYLLRRALLTGYDKMVRPVLKPTDVVNVTFDVELNALSEVVSGRLHAIYQGLQRGSQSHLPAHISRGSRIPHISFFYIAFPNPVLFLVLLMNSHHTPRLIDLIWPLERLFSDFPKDRQKVPLPVPK